MTQSMLKEFRDKKYILPAIISIITIVSMIAAITSCVLAVKDIANQNSESDSTLIATTVSNGIDNIFMKPITVSETMAHDYNLKSYLKETNKGDSKENSKKIQTYLSSIRSGMGYDMAFAVSDENRAYYTYKGFTHYLDTERDSDRWYDEFVNKGKHYDLDVDVDEANNWGLSIFVNTKVIDSEGHFIGVSGVAVKMTELQQLIKRYERKYDIDICLVNKEGLIQVASDTSKIEKEYVDCSQFNMVFENADRTFYFKDNNESKVIAYLPNLDWYLVVRDRDPNKIDILSIVVPSMVIFLIGIVLIIVSTIGYTSRARSVSKDLFQKTRMSYVDELTDLFNRRAYVNDIEEFRDAEQYADMSIVVIDINGLKEVNDTLGHLAGDELIKGAAVCIRKSFRHLGNMYRTGGDEFVALLRCDEQRLNQAILQLDKEAREWSGKYSSRLYLAKGIVNCKYHLNESFDTLQDIADKRMYDDKNEFYKSTENDRRRRSGICFS